MSYEDFVASKLTRQPPTGLSDVSDIHPSLFPHQRDLVTWALRRGRSAVFAATGLGKSRIEVEWARHVVAEASGRVLMLAPLAVAQQTIREGAELGVDIAYVRTQPDGDRDASGHAIWITNYERVHAFDASRFAGVVLDESSIIKHHSGKTLAKLIDQFGQTRFKLCATATPSPNDYTELGTHAEFLGICTRAEMLAEFFCHDGGDTSVWRLKGHARVAFWQWVSSWGALLRKPSDLGYRDGGYELPKLTVHKHIVISRDRPAGMLFNMEAKTLSDRRTARKSSIVGRVDACANIVMAESKEPWIVWCDLNAESKALVKEIPDSVEVTGSDSPEEKELAMTAFSEGRVRVLVSKSSICGFGMNWQHCARMAFVGVTDSWESYHQAIRRCWRFGQKRDVDVHVFASEAEGSVVSNLNRKELDAARMAAELATETRESMRAEIRGSARSTNVYRSPSIKVPSWLKEEA